MSFITDLLYPQVLEHAATHAKCPLEQRRLAMLRVAPVYELSSVVTAFENHTHTNDQPISKRPPHDTLWAEHKWDERGDDGTIAQKWTIGNLVHRVNLETAQATHEEAVRNHPEWTPTPEATEAVKQAEACYALFRFYRCDWACDGDWSLGVGKICFQVGQFLAFYRDDFTRVQHFYRLPEANSPRTVIGNFGLTTTFVHYNASTPMTSSWPLEACFALLHCKNVVCETVSTTAKQRRRFRREGCKPPPDYRVLRLTKTVRASEETAKEDSDNTVDEERSGVRFHLVAGHYKNLQAALQRQRVALLAGTLARRPRSRGFF
ncbi:MAG: hypothetical protein ACYDH4_12595 [Candidatus Cryosericum sp.]